MFQLQCELDIPGFQELMIDKQRVFGVDKLSGALQKALDGSLVSKGTHTTKSASHALHCELAGANQKQSEAGRGRSGTTRPATPAPPAAPPS